MSYPLRFCAGFAILFSLLPPAVLAADSCAWMSTERLDELLPDFAPWELLSGGDAKSYSCTFIDQARTGGTAMILASHVSRANAEGAAEVAQDLRQQALTQGQIVDEPALGEFGFHYAESTSRATYAGHYENEAMSGQIILSPDFEFEKYRAGATAFMRAALGVTDMHAERATADDPDSTAVAAPCPWFDEGTLRKLLPGEGFSQHAVGNTYCVAQNGQTMAVLLTVMENALAVEAEHLRVSSCTWEPVAGLGDDAMIGYGCRDGNPRAMLQTQRGETLLIYTFLPLREPTPAERQLLRDMAQAAQTP